jgi:hypothetical protein
MGHSPPRPLPPIPRCQVRKTYPLKNLHDMRFSRGAAGGSPTGAPPPQQQQQQSPRPWDAPPSGSAPWASRDGDGPGGGGGGGAPVVELRLASSHSVPEHVGAYVFSELQQAMMFMSLAVQLLR